MTTLYVLRSRFQPFTVYHFDVIVELIRHHKAEFDDDQAMLVLAVIRDHETLFRLHGKHLKLDITTEDVRHLPLFNPLTTPEIIHDIQQDLRHRVAEIDSGDDDSKIIRNALENHTVILPVYVKFKDLIAIRKDPTTLPSGISELYGRKPPGLMAGKDPKMSNKGAALRSLNCQVLDVFSRASDSHAAQIKWCIPLFDHEDKIDLCSIDRGSAIPVLFDPHPPSVENIGSLDVPVPVGLYGVFAAYALARYYNHAGLDGLNEYDELHRFAFLCVSKKILERYIKRLTILIEGGNIGESSAYHRHSFGELCRANMGLVGESGIRDATNQHVDTITVSLNHAQSKKAIEVGQVATGFAGLRMKLSMDMKGDHLSANVVTRYAKAIKLVDLLLIVNQQGLGDLITDESLDTLRIMLSELQAQTSVDKLSIAGSIEDVTQAISRCTTGYLP